jgi:hypothetical protein
VRAILIDPTTRNVTDVAFSGDFDELYGLISVEHKRPVELVQSVYLREDVVMWVDEEGLLIDGVPTFSLTTFPADSVFAGKAIVLGETPKEDFADAPPLADIANLVQWTNALTTGDMAPSKVYESNEIVIIEGGRPILRQPNPEEQIHE